MINVKDFNINIFKLFIKVIFDVIVYYIMFYLISKIFLLLGFWFKLIFWLIFVFLL